MPTVLNPYFMRKLFFFFLFSGLSFLQAQELNCNVQIITPKLQTADPKIFQTLKNSIREFMSNRKWTGDSYTNQEKIECSILINITKELGIDRFTAQVTIQSNRPVFNSSYQSLLLNYVDKDFEFGYTEFQPLDYNDNTGTNNLTSFLAYYAYIILGIDYDTYSLKGGTPYFLKAQSVVNNAQNYSESGWRSNEKTIRNRYWLVENFLSGKYDEVRQAFYKYHLNGMDKMYEDMPGARKVITQCLSTFDKINSDYPNSFLVQLFFNAKAEELVGIYSQATPSEKATAVQLCSKLDATNAVKYQGILKVN